MSPTRAKVTPKTDAIWIDRSADMHLGVVAIGEDDDEVLRLEPRDHPLVVGGQRKVAGLHLSLGDPLAGRQAHLEAG